jgi:hypothetical protein
MSAIALISGSMAQRMVLRKAQPRDRGVEFPGIHENDQRVVARARGERFRRQRPQQRMIGRS